jgi:hypothetical protein
MSIALAVRQLRFHLDVPGSHGLYGRLRLDASGARLFDNETPDLSVPLTDAAALAAIRAVLPPAGEYDGEVYLDAFVRDGAGGVELYRVDCVRLDTPEDKPPREWGPRIEVRRD